ncbi:hypothetical protein ACF0H5_009536 [Mactra antiquata]
MTALAQHSKDQTLLILLPVLQSGVGVGGMVHPYILSYLSEKYGFRGVLLLYGGVYANIISGCCLWRMIKTDENKENGQTRLQEPFVNSLRAILKNFEFVVFWLGSAISITWLSIIFIFIADIFVDKKLRQNDSTFGLFLMHISNVLGRLLPAFTLLKGNIPILWHPFITTLISVGGMVGFLFASTRWLILMFCALVGACFGMLVSMLSVISTSVVGVKHLSTASGLIFTTFGILNSIMGPVVGSIRDSFGTYDIMFYCAIGLTGSAATLLAIALIRTRLISHGSNQQPDIVESEVSCQREKKTMEVAHNET